MAGEHAKSRTLNLPNFHFLESNFIVCFFYNFSLKDEANDITSAKCYSCIFCVVSRKFNRNILLYLTEYHLL